MTGRVYLVGAGPGNPGLLTLRAAQLLRRAKVLLYDALAGDAIVALAPPTCERIFVGKRGGDHALAQDAIEALMIAKAREGRDVVRLKGGDPFVFGRGGEEAQALHAAGIPFEVVPGISSALAVPAYAGIPVTHREYVSSFTVLTGHEDPSKPASTLDWTKLADPRRTLVMLMASANLKEIAQHLIAHGVPPETPAAVIWDGTRPSQRCVLGTIESIAGAAAEAKIGAPAVVVIGDVARLREQLRWFDGGGLFGRRVAITRAGRQSEAFADALLERGAEPVFAPAIAIEPPDDPGPAQRALDELSAFAWVVFTSQNGVDAFFAQLRARGRDARAIGTAKVAAIGDRTAAKLADYGVKADAVPEEFVGEAVANTVSAGSRAGDRVLIFRAQEARDTVPAMLAEAGRNVTVVPAYKTVVPNDPIFARKIAGADVITFTSASTVRGFLTLLRGDSAAAHGKLIACIGPVTASAAADAGLRVDVIATTYTTAGLLAALETYFAAVS